MRQFKSIKLVEGERGFALVELIVVVALLATLAVIAIPALGDIPQLARIRATEAQADTAAKSAVLAQAEGGASAMNSVVARLNDHNSDITVAVFADATEPGVVCARAQWRDSSKNVPIAYKGRGCDGVTFPGTGAETPIGSGTTQPGSGDGSAGGGDGSIGDGGAGPGNGGSGNGGSSTGGGDAVGNDGHITSPATVRQDGPEYICWNYTSNGIGSELRWEPYPGAIEYRLIYRLYTGGGDWNNDLGPTASVTISADTTTLKLLHPRDVFGAKMPANWGINGADWAYVLEARTEDGWIRTSVDDIDSKDYIPRGMFIGAPPTDWPFVSYVTCTG